LSPFIYPCVDLPLYFCVHSMFVSVSL